MKRFGWVKILGIIGTLILIFMNSYWSVPARSADSDTSAAAESKVSSLLSMHIKMKQAQPAFSAQNTDETFRGRTGINW